MKVRWIGDKRELADPQIEVKKGDEIDVDRSAAASFVHQGLAEYLDKDTKKEND